jgi:glutamate-1-semialdehyde 2,1-aminomutase
VYAQRLAARIVDLVPSAELVRYANSGSEATMAAIRLARAHTGRSKILKFEGHFHGLHDHVIFSTHPPPRDPGPGGELLEPTVDSGGIPDEFVDLVLVAPWGDAAAVERAFRKHANEIAAVIMEPVNYNSGCLIADPDYMKTVRDLAHDGGAVLIYDEILSGFRTGADCAQGYYGVTPDVTLLGKAVANGVPLAIIAGRREIMETFSPLGSAAHSGTYSGHIFGLLAGLATLDELTSPGFYDGPDGIFSAGDRLYGGLRDIFERHSIRCRVQGLGARFGLYFGLDPVAEPKVYQDVAGHDSSSLKKFIAACYERGVYFHSYDVALGHHGFGASHGLAEIDEALSRIDDACSNM